VTVRTQGSLPGVWRNPDFLKLWLGGSISAIGSQVTVLAMPLIAVLSFGAGPAETGVMTAAGFAPMLILGLPAGAWIDRMRRRPVRIAADLASALVVGCVPLAGFLGVLRLEHLYVVAFLGGTLTIFARLTVSAMLPPLVGRNHLIEANGALMTSFSLAQIAGPALAGLLVQVVAPPVVLLVDATSFLVSAGCFVMLREPPSPPRERTGSSMGEEIVEGLRWLRNDAVLFRLTVSIGLANLAWFGVQAVLVPFATRELQLTPALLGLALGVTGPTSRLGAVLAARAARRIGLGPTLIVSLSGEFLSRVVLLLAGGPPLAAAGVVGLSQAIFGFIAPLWDVNANSLRQSVTPQRLIGRVTAASGFVGMGTAPIGALMGGWIGEIAGPRIALLTAACITLAAVGCLWSSPMPRQRTPPAPAHAE
jgi:predicted MFS family arabinose efflux permease